MTGAYKLVKFVHRTKKLLSTCPHEVARAGLYKSILDKAKAGTPSELAKVTREKLMPLYCPRCQHVFQEMYDDLAKDFPELGP